MEHIFQSAIQLFAKHGYSKISVNEIAQAANVSPATIYNYFGTKEQLYRDMLLDWLDKQLAECERILYSDMNFREKTKEIWLCEARSLTQLSGEFLLLAASEIEGVMELMENYHEEKLSPFMAQFVAMGKREGCIHESRSDEVIALVFSMYKNELVRLWSDPKQIDARRYIEELLDMLFYGLMGDAPCIPEPFLGQ